MSRLVTKIEPLQWQRALELEDEAKVQAAAMRALRSVMRPRVPSQRPRPTRGDHAGRGGGGRGRGRGRGRGLWPGGDSATSTETEQSEPSETEEYWNQIMGSLLDKKKKNSGATSSGGKSSGAAAASGQVDPPEPPPPGPKAKAKGKARRKQQARNYVPAPGGGLMTYEAYPVEATGTVYENWIFVCQKHEACQKTRGVFEASIARLGELEPLAFLCAWHEMVVSKGKKHRLCRPSAAQVEAQLDAKLAALAEVNARFRV